MKFSLSLLIITAWAAAGCAVQRTPMANITPSYSYQQDGLVLTEPARTTSQARRGEISDFGLGIAD